MSVLFELNERPWGCYLNFVGLTPVPLIKTICAPKLTSWGENPFCEIVSAGVLSLGDESLGNKPKCLLFQFVRYL